MRQRWDPLSCPWTSLHFLGVLYASVFMLVECVKQRTCGGALVLAEFAVGSLAFVGVVASPRSVETELT